ncbi:hypothetical protein EYF80_024339 [Liparis tanakae]|uniref:Uncharacterized protein n=1 Tax=Liparis tanakae TaxID=230148 RepID=A0A4Z2HHM2_9TELE|nr:hypothetical protein EYF80_024339 [Liparis tanakae]
MVGHVQHSPETVIHRREGGIQHHADRGKGLDDALDGLEGSAAALLRLLHEAAGGNVFRLGEAAVPSKAVALAVASAIASTIASASPVGAVAPIHGAPILAVGGGARAVRRTVSLLDGTRGNRGHHPGQDRRACRVGGACSRWKSVWDSDWLITGARGAASKHCKSLMES